MATLQKAIKVGSSVAAVLPKALLKQTGITAGTPITVEAIDGALLVRPAARARRAARGEGERVAETALSLINRYQDALDRLADERDKSVWKTVIDFKKVNRRGVPAEMVLKALSRMHESN